MQKEVNETIKQTLSFFNLNEGIISFNKDFGVFLVSIKQNNLFNYEFANALELVLHTILPKDVFLKVDYNNSFTKFLEGIKDEVNTVVNQSKYYNKPMVLKSKNAFERRLKHYYVDIFYNVRHESFGEGLDRQIIIYPK